jgi:hypothetical protein
MKHLFTRAMALTVILLAAGFTACESPAGGGGGEAENGRLIITGFPAGAALVATVYNYSGTIANQLEYVSAIANPIGVSPAGTSSPVTLYRTDAGGGTFTQNGVFLVALVDSANPASGVLFKTGVSFANGNAAINYGELVRLADLPLGGGDDFSINQVTVSAASPSVSRGSNVQFSAVVTGTGNPPQAVSWSITGSHAAGTSITNGLLSVTVDEPASSLTVRAASVLDPSKYGEETVAVTGGGGGFSINQVTVSPANASVSRGSSVPFSAVVTGTGNPPQTVSWSITGSHAAGTSITNGLLSVAADEPASSLTVRAASTVDSSKYGEAVAAIGGDLPSGGALITITFEGPNEDITIADEVVSGSLTLSVANAGTYSNFRWTLDGAERSETSGSITINTAALDIGPHRITVIAVKAGISYSREIKFQVNG